MTSFTYVILTVVLGFLVSGNMHPQDTTAVASVATSSRLACSFSVSVENFTWWKAEEIESCSSDKEWLCMDRGKCVSRNAVCSGVADCDDGSDEFARFCGCKVDEFRCGDLCIPCLQRCDRVKNCPNGEDEKDCLTHQCPHKFYQCKSDGTCVSFLAVCNHTEECVDGSDEMNCNNDGYRTCHKSEFQCLNQKCLRPADICDGIDQCEDENMSDERECNATDFKTCKSGKKIHKTWLCDNWVDCSEEYYKDDTDELGCNCTKDQFKCSNSRCIFKGNVCDSKCDCFDKCDDEKNCTSVYSNESGVVECLKGYSVESNGRCIARESICDGVKDAYGKDITEHGCYDNKTGECSFSDSAKREKPLFFQCAGADLRCIPIYMMCNGHRDCLDGDDEANCGENGACGKDEIMCLNGSCIPKKARCNGVIDCRNASDERFCVEGSVTTPTQGSDPKFLFEEYCEIKEVRNCSSDEWRCWICGECINRTSRCDSKFDCFYGSDEQNCADNTCAEGQFRCSSGHCVPMDVRCDATFDCNDKSDEKYCSNHECGRLRRKCKSGQCVKLEAWCNGIPECPDESDERDCDPPRECGPDEWQCRNGQCVPKEHRCVVNPDQRLSCLDRSHLLGCADEVCGDGMFKCYRGPCLDMKYKCDRNVDCPFSWSDQNGCPFRCSNSRYNCSCVDQTINCTYTGLRKFPHVQDRINRYNFAHNKLGETLLQEPINGHRYVIYLNLCDNHITELGNETLAGMPLLWNLILCNNNITTITNGNFKGLRQLKDLDLTGNKITNIGPYAFDGLTSLSKLDLSHQRINEIAGNAFRGLDNLKTLLLHNNYLTAISNRDTFAGLSHLEKLHLTGNKITSIGPGVFQGLRSLTELKVDANPLQEVDKEIFVPLQNLTSLTTPEFRFCCLVHHAQECLPLTDDFSSCEDLMSNMVLRVFVWVVGFVALIGNTFVIIWRLLYPSTNKKNHSLLFVNLALGDLLMGVYLLMIAGVDLRYRGVYRVYERSWRSSPTCQIAGFLSTFSSEASVFTLTVITLDRLTMIISDFGVRRVHEGLAKQVMVGVWVLAFFLAALPLISFLPYFDNFYGRSGVCLALHITNEKPNGWEYSVFIFLVLNLLSFAAIAVSYVLIYAKARKQPLMESGRNRHGRDREMGRRVTYIVGTDAACWLPIIMLGIASLSGAWIPRKVFSWVAVFVLPLNAAINPLLYTFFTDPVRKRLKDLRQSFSSWRTRSTGSSIVSGVRMASTSKGRVPTELTDILGTGSDGLVHPKAAICVYTPVSATSSQVTHFIHEPPEQNGGKFKEETFSDQNDGDVVHIMYRPHIGQGYKTRQVCEAEGEPILPLDNQTNN